MIIYTCNRKYTISILIPADPAGEGRHNMTNPALISISNGNNKMGAIPSVSLPAVRTCRPGAPCAKKCYAVKLERLRPTVRNAYARNLEIYQNAPDLFFAQLGVALKMNRYFRLHVSGDFINADYFKRCAEAVKAAPGCTVLAFTKQYEIVNAYIDEGNEIPENFKIIFSTWGAWRPENPHNFPESAVIFKDAESVPDEWKICGGNCSECACRGCGCWELKKGETIAFYEH